MQLCVLGLNHKSASLSLRDRVTSRAFKLFKNRRWANFEDATVLIATCNRCELYFISPKGKIDTQKYLRLLLGEEYSLEEASHFYFYQDIEALYHLHRVCCGLDSAVIGETEILGQIKRAFSTAIAQQNFPHFLHFAFEKTLHSAKRFRLSHLRSPLTPTLQQNVLEEIRVFFPNLNPSILLIGASATNENLLYYLSHHGFTNLSLIHRSQTHRSESIQRNFPQVSHLPWGLRFSWPDFHVILIATKAPKTLDAFTQDFIYKVQTKAKHPRLLIDMSVPRNIPAHTTIPASRILNIDDLLNDTNTHKIDPKLEQISRECVRNIWLLWLKKCAKRQRWMEIQNIYLCLENDDTYSMGQI